MDDPKHFFDTHTLYVTMNLATPDQLKGALAASIADAEKKLGVPVPCRSRINIPRNKENKTYGFAFVFVTNPQIYHMLLGRKPDGKENVDYIDDPSWVQPGKDSASGWATSWSDMMDDEDSRECPRIKVELPPIIELPPYIYTPEQKALRQAQMKGELKISGSSDEPQVPDRGYFTVSAAFVTEVDKNFAPNILRSCGVPKWVTATMLKGEFTPYASDSKTEHKRTVHGRIIREPYPFVTMLDDGVVFIIFDPMTHDAGFALHMMKKLNIRQGDKEATLIFSMSYRNQLKEERPRRPG